MEISKKKFEPMSYGIELKVDKKLAGPLKKWLDECNKKRLIKLKKIILKS